MPLPPAIYPDNLYSSSNFSLLLFKALTHNLSMTFIYLIFYCIFFLCISHLFQRTLSSLTVGYRPSFSVDYLPFHSALHKQAFKHLIQNGYLNRGCLTVVSIVQNLLFSWDRTLGTGCFVICISFGLDFRKKFLEFYREDEERKANVSSFQRLLDNK